MRSIFLLLFVCLLISCNSEGQNISKPQEFEATNFNEFLTSLKKVDLANRQAIVDSFLDTLSSVPVIEGSSCYFIFSGNASSVQVAGDFTFWNPTDREFTKLEGTELWFRLEEFALNARLDYKLVVDGNWMLDPRNPNQISGGFGPNSELAMPEYEQPMEIETYAGVPQGMISTESILSTNTGKTYSVKVYTPPNYDDSIDYPAVYFQDGQEYLNLASATTVIDNLIDAGAIQPLIGVFTIPTNRNLEYAEGDQFKYRDFFVNELVPFVDSKYATIKSSESRAVLGDSYGGNISAIIAFTRPDIFGNCGLHSGAFQVNDFATNDIVMSTVKDVKVASIWGSYEGGLSENMRKIKDHLLANDYDLYWKELPEGHSWGLWRATLDDMLIHFFPAK